jgi:Uncharacterised nucleotidyltransferase
MTHSAAATTSVLHLAEAVPLLHGVVDEVARRRGVRVLFIKGPTLTQQGLRDAHPSVDVDVLVDPARVADLRHGLEELGWAIRVPSTSAQVLPMHSVTYAHPLWPCEIDVHDRFPGFLADPQTTFETLWCHRTTAHVAGREMSCPRPAAHAAIAALHALRDADSATSQHQLSRLIDVLTSTFDDAQRAELVAVARRAGAEGTLWPVLRALGVADDGSPATPHDLTDWRIRTASTGVRSIGWVLELRRTPLRRWPAILLHALLLTEGEIRDAQPEAAPGAWGLLRARLRRLGWGLRDLPRAVRIIRGAGTGRSDRADRTHRVGRADRVPAR